MPDYDDEPSEDYEDDYLDYPDEDSYDEFEQPGGHSALRKATADNPRIHSCPQCGQEDMLTAKDVALHYICDDCADRAEGYGDLVV